MKTVVLKLVFCVVLAMPSMQLLGQVKVYRPQSVEKNNLYSYSHAAKTGKLIPNTDAGNMVKTSQGRIMCVTLTTQAHPDGTIDGLEISDLTNSKNRWGTPSLSLSESKRRSAGSASRGDRFTFQVTRNKKGELIVAVWADPRLADQTSRDSFSIVVDELYRWRAEKALHGSMRMKLGDRTYHVINVLSHGRIPGSGWAFFDPRDLSMTSGRIRPRYFVKLKQLVDGNYLSRRGPLPIGDSGYVLVRSAIRGGKGFYVVEEGPNMPLERIDTVPALPIVKIPELPEIPELPDMPKLSNLDLPDLSLGKSGNTTAKAPEIVPFNVSRAKEVQQEWSRYLEVPAKFTSSNGLKLVFVPPGEFMMGAKDSILIDLDVRRHEKPSHLVRIKKGFFLQATETTQGQWKRVMATSPWKGKLKKSGFKHAADFINWFDAVEYCVELSRNEGLRPCYKLTSVKRNDGGSIDSAKVEFVDGNGYRLPTEAEWEYACRAGTSTKFFFGDDSSNLGQHAWFDANTQKVREWFPHEAGSKTPNAFGLHDMHGNVWEWCQDWYDALYYSDAPMENPKGPATGSKKVLRGGSWGRGPKSARSTNRHSLPPSSRYGDIGFRVVLNKFPNADE